RNAFEEREEVLLQRLWVLLTRDTARFGVFFQGLTPKLVESIHKRSVDAASLSPLVRGYLGYLFLKEAEDLPVSPAETFPPGNKGEITSLTQWLHARNHRDTTTFNDAWYVRQINHAVFNRGGGDSYRFARNLIAYEIDRGTRTISFDQGHRMTDDGARWI